MKAFFLGFERRANLEKEAEVVYHGSPAKVSVLKPANLVPGNTDEDAVHAARWAGIALPYAGKRWYDRDIHQSAWIKEVPGQRAGTWREEYTLEEMRPGAFDEAFKGQKGYLYSLPAGKFHINPKGAHESGDVVSRKKVRPLKVETITDIPKRLKEEGVVLRKYDPSSPIRLEKVKNMRASMKSMTPDKRREYLDWIGETNPELKQELLK